MSEQQRGLEELAKQKRQALLAKNPPVKREKIEGNIEDFIEKDIDDDEFYASSDSQKEDEDAKKMPNNQQQITQFMGQNRKKKQTGIKLSDDMDEIEQVIQQVKVEKVSLNQIVTNSDELYKAQYNQPIKPKQHQEELREEDLDEIFSLLEQKKEKQKEQKIQQQQQQQIKAMQQKQLPIHRQVEVKVELPQMKIEQSTINIDQITSKVRDIMDIVEKNDSILFYWIDIYEDQTRFPGCLFVFGKVKNHKLNVYDSCSLYFEDYRKTIYLSYENGKYTDQELIQECQILMKKQLGLGSKDFSYQFVDRQYAFEIADIPTNQQKYIEVSYTLKHGKQMPVRLENPIFKYALQSTQTLVEQFLIYNKIRGPCWLQLKSCKTLDKNEFYLKTQHALQLTQNGFQVFEGELPLPSLKLLSFAITQCKEDKEDQIIAISYTIQNNIDINDAEVPEQVVYQTLARMPSDAPLPPGYIKGQNKQVKDFESECSMLSQFLQTVEDIDPDGLVGHELQKKTIDQLFARIAKLKVYEWNRMSRLQKKEQIPKNLYLRSKYITIGRLIIDLWVQAKDMIKSNDYSMTYLAKEFLKQDCQQLESDVTKNYTENAQSYQSLLQLCQKETKFVIQITQKLNIISLTRQLTNICGNVWNRSLLNQRAERNEMLLMHEFFSRGFILPDRMSKINLTDEEKEQQMKEQESKKTYGGGLVFEPKADIYTQYVLLLDFNSLYPSIIMEYNICFTTVQRDKISFEVDQKQQEEEKTQDQVQKSNNKKKMKKDKIQEENDLTQNNKDFIGEVDPDAGNGILPQIIEKLVNMRKVAKREMSKSSGLMKQIYNIKQLAVKLVANSIYGCLGFSSSRFYAVGIASLITQKGRQILMDSKNTVERNNDVIYGDTDSMMICARQEKNLQDILILGNQIAREINKKYKKLVLAIDGVFDTLLLMKKKKYAGIKIDNLEELMAQQSNIPKLKREIKGIDLVRREFCDISKQIQSHVLDILLETKNRDDIHSDMITLMQEIRQMFDALNGKQDPQQLIAQNKFIKQEIKTSDFIIVKQLQKLPQEYTDNTNAPHAQVALRMVKKYGKTPQSLVNHFIRYVICEDPTIKNLAQRAYLVDELLSENLTIDYHYYLSSQIFDPVVRLCKNVQVISIPELAQILGLKSYQTKDKQNNEFFDFKIDETQRKELDTIDKFTFKCPVCKEDQYYSSFFDRQKLFVKQLSCQSKQCTFSLENLKSISNQTKLLIKKDLCNEYYKGLVKCKHSNTIQTNVCRKGTCLSTCCEKEKEKERKVIHIFDEEIINTQINLLQKFLKKILSEINNQIKAQQSSKTRVYYLQEEQQFQQPFCLIRLNEIFKKLQI